MTLEFITLTGQIVNYIDNNPIKDLTIKVYNQDNIELVSGITDENGNYRVVFNAGSKDIIRIEVYTRDYFLKKSIDINIETKEQDAVLNFAITMPGIIWGKLINSDNTAVPSKIVRCFKKLFGSEELLDTTKTDENGKYFLYYDRDKEDSNVIVNLYEDAAASEPLNSTGLITAIAQTKEINFLYKSEPCFILNKPKNEKNS